MADPIRPKDLPAAPSVPTSASIMVDNGVTVDKATPIQVVDAAIPLASQADAEAGTDNTKRVTALRVKQAIDSQSIGKAMAAAIGVGGADANMGTTPGTILSDNGTAKQWFQESESAIEERLLTVPTFAGAAAYPIPANAAVVQIKDTRAKFKRVVSEPSHSLKFSNGGWWEIDEPILYDYMAGSGSSALQAVLTAAGAMGLRDVYGVGSYSLSAMLDIPANVQLWGSGRKLTLTQAAGANLASVVNLNSGSAIYDVIVDGGSASNTRDDAKATIRIGASDDCKIHRCLIRNAPSFGIVANGGKRASILSNEFDRVYSSGIACFGSSAAKDGHDMRGNRFTDMGAGALLLQESNGNTFSGNFVKNNITGVPGSRLRVNASGTTITWVSGPNFSNVMPGMWVTIDNGKEYRVSVVNSNTQLTVLPNPASLPALSNTPVMIGTGDLVGVIASQDSIISDNHLEGAVTFGFGYSLATTSVASGKSIFSNNLVRLTGKQGVNLAGEISGDILVGEVRDISIIGNRLVDTGCGAGIGSNDKIAMFVSSSAGKVYNILFANNSVMSTMTFGDNDGRSTYWLGTDGLLAVGAISATGNEAFGMVNPGIFNDVKAVVLTSDWGSTTAKPVVYQNGNEVIISITCSGTFTASGIGAQIGIQKIVDKPGERPVVNAKVVGANFVNGANLFAMFGDDQSTRGNWISYLNATPANGQGYTISFKA